MDWKGEYMRIGDQPFWGLCVCMSVQSSNPREDDLQIGSSKECVSLVRTSIDWASLLLRTAGGNCLLPEQLGTRPKFSLALLSRYRRQGGDWFVIIAILLTIYNRGRAEGTSAVRAGVEYSSRSGRWGWLLGRADYFSVVIRPLIQFKLHIPCQSYPKKGMLNLFLICQPQFYRPVLRSCF